MTTYTDPVRALIAKWRRQAAEHGTRTFTGNDHALFANELESALASAPPSAPVRVEWDMPCGECSCGVYDARAFAAFDGTFPKCKRFDRYCVGAIHCAQAISQQPAAPSGEACDVCRGTGEGGSPDGDCAACRGIGRTAAPQQPAAVDGLILAAHRVWSKGGDVPGADWDALGNALVPFGGLKGVARRHAALAAQQQGGRSDG